ncbi:hypothetical protein, partial [Paraburkholderia sp. J67]|uniref:hypothetical protein n=1 Tax=Paraburkholderia sp. J67 TaxID=2805435 RepID=UPI002ABDA4F6
TAFMAGVAYVGFMKWIYTPCLNGASNTFEHRFPYSVGMLPSQMRANTAPHHTFSTSETFKKNAAPSGSGVIRKCLASRACV